MVDVVVLALPGSVVCQQCGSQYVTAWPYRKNATAVQLQHSHSYVDCPHEDKYLWFPYTEVKCERTDE